jgi:mono/diheme cytochrome c family protein
MRTGDGRRVGLFVCLLSIGHLLDLAPVRADPTSLLEAMVQDRMGSIREGYRRYQGVCAHCHGPDGVGSTFASSLIDPLPPYDRFVAVAMNGVTGPRSVMRGFAGDPNVEPYLDAIYAYLAGRATGHLGRGRPAVGPTPSAP